jgi:hypothetical protein
MKQYTIEELKEIAVIITQTFFPSEKKYVIRNTGAVVFFEISYLSVNLFLTIESFARNKRIGLFIDSGETDITISINIYSYDI